MLLSPSFVRIRPYPLLHYMHELEESSHYTQFSIRHNSHDSFGSIFSVEVFNLYPIIQVWHLPVEFSQVSQFSGH